LSLPPAVFTRWMKVMSAKVLQNQLITGSSERAPKK